MQTIFGTDGIRAAVGSSLFTPQKLVQLGKAIGCWAQKKYGLQPKILISHDTRISSDFVKAALKAGLLQYSVRLFDAFVVPTPALAHLLATKEFNCAIMISASHNPYQDNGIKIIDAQQGKLLPVDEQLISKLFLSDTLEQNNSGDNYGCDIPFIQAAAQYCTLVQNYFPKNLLENLTIVLDVAYGATYQVAPRIFSALGAQVITLHNKPDGYNINQTCGSLHTQALQQAVITHQAKIGFAFDGDGDRVIAVNRSGMIKNGDDIVALLIEHPDYKKETEIVGTIMTNQGLIPFLEAHNKKLIRTPVGDKYIAEQLNTKKLLLGGEQSGHIILGNMINTGDGILVALKLLETLKLNNNWDLETFTPFPQVMLNIPVSNKKDLHEQPYCALINSAQQQIPLGRISVRYSGTEPLLRVMVESDTHETATLVCQNLASALAKVL